ncbi:MAG: hypothetical protein Kow0089_21960 [Desulfobulbaceae bacterium]
MYTQPVTIVTDSQLEEHDTGGGDHPEAPERLGVILDALQKGTLGERLRFVSPAEARREWLLAFHSEAWLFRFEEEVLAGRSYIGHPDNQVCYETFRAALLAAGAGPAAIELVEKGGAGPVFCAVRPPGHHAETSQPHGFCFLNNCVIAARYWQQTCHRRRVCVLDFDAHHGNGIQSAFETDPETLYISLHEHPSFSYPGTGLEEEIGTGPGEGTICNLTLQPGGGDREALTLLDGRAAAAITAFCPDALVVAAGFDGHRLDDMSGLCYTTSVFEKIGERIGCWGRELCGGRVVSILEGGYHLPVLGESVEAYLRGLDRGLRGM